LVSRDNDNLPIGIGFDFIRFYLFSHKISHVIKYIIMRLERFITFTQIDPKIDNVLKKWYLGNALVAKYITGDVRCIYF